MFRLLGRPGRRQQPQPGDAGVGSEDGDDAVSCSTVAETVRGMPVAPHPAEDAFTIRAGWVYKQSTKKKAFTGRPIYNLRYFILQGVEDDGPAGAGDHSGGGAAAVGGGGNKFAVLSWYESNTASKPNDSLELTRDCGARSLPAMDKPLHKKFHLELTVPGKRVYVLRTSSDDSRAEWISALNGAISPRTDGSTCTLVSGRSPGGGDGGDGGDGRGVGDDGDGGDELEASNSSDAARLPQVAALETSAVLEALHEQEDEEEEEEEVAVASPATSEPQGVGADDDDEEREGDDETVRESPRGTLTHPMEDALTIRGGWLFKQTLNKRGHRRRYFILQGATNGPAWLCWYDSNTAVLCKDFVSLTEDVTVRPLPSLDRPAQRHYYLELNVPAKQRAYALRASTEVERSEWVTAIASALTPVEVVDQGTEMSPPASPLSTCREEDEEEEEEDEEEEGNDDDGDKGRTTSIAINAADGGAVGGVAVMSATFEGGATPPIQPPLAAPLTSTPPPPSSSPSRAPPPPVDGSPPTLGRFQTPRQHPSPLRNRRQNLGPPPDDAWAVSPHALPTSTPVQLDYPLSGTSTTSLAATMFSDTSPPRRQAQGPLQRPTHPQHDLDSPDRRRQTFTSTSSSFNSTMCQTTSISGSGGGGALLSPSPYRQKHGGPSSTSSPLTPPTNRSGAASMMMMTMTQQQQQAHMTNGDGSSFWKTAMMEDAGLSPSSSLSPSKRGLTGSVGEGGLERQVEILMAMNVKLLAEQEVERRTHAESFKRLSAQVEEERERHAEETRILALHIQELGGEGNRGEQLAKVVEEERQRADELQRQVQELVKAKEEAKRFVEEAREMQAQCTKRETAAVDAKQAAERKARGLEAEVSLLRELNEELREKVQEGEEERKRLKDKAGEKDQAVALVKRQLREAERSLAEALAEAETLREEKGEEKDGKIMEVWKQNKELRHKVAILEVEKREREKSLEALTRELETMMDQHRGVASQADELATEVSRLQRERDEALAALSAATAHAEASRLWQQHMEATQGTIQMDPNQQLIPQSELSHAHARIKELEKRVSEENGWLEELRSVAATEGGQQQQQHGKGGGGGGGGGRRTGPVAVVDQVKKVMVALRGEVSRMQAQVAKAKEEAALGDKMCDALKRASAELRQELARRDKDIADLNGKVKAMRDSQQASEREAAATLASLGKEKSALESQVAGLEARLSAAQEEMDKAEALLQRDVKRLAPNDSLLEEIVRLREESDTAHSQVEILGQQVEVLKRQAHMAQEELEETRRQLQAKREKQSAQAERVKASLEELEHARVGVEQAKATLATTQKERDEALAEVERLQMATMATMEGGGADGEKGEVRQMAARLREVEVARDKAVEELELEKERAHRMAATIMVMEDAAAKRRQAAKDRKDAASGTNGGAVRDDGNHGDYSGDDDHEEGGASGQNEWLERLTSLERELQQERAKAKDAERQAKASDEQLTKAMAATDQAKMDLNDLQYMLQVLEEAKAELEGRLKSEEARCAALEGFNQDAASCVRKLEEEAKVREGEWEEARKVAKTMARRVEQLQEEVKGKKGEVEVGKRELQDAVRRVEVMEKEERRLREEAKGLKHQVEEMVEREEGVQRRMQNLVAVVKRADEERAVWEQEVAETHEKEMKEREEEVARLHAQVETLREQVKQLQGRVQEEERKKAEVMEELATAKKGLQMWEGRLNEEVGRLSLDLDEERGRTRELQEVAGQERRRAVEADQARDAALRTRRQGEQIVSAKEAVAKEEARLTEARLLLEAERQKVEAMRLALTREKRTIDEQMVTLSKEVSESLQQVQRRKEALLQHSSTMSSTSSSSLSRAQQENFRPNCTSPVSYLSETPIAADFPSAYAARAMAERNAISTNTVPARSSRSTTGSSSSLTEQVRRQADESRQLQGSVQTLKAELREAYNQVGELARLRARGSAMPSSKQQRPASDISSSSSRGSSSTKTSKRGGREDGASVTGGGGKIYTREEVLRMQKELEHRRHRLVREETSIRKP